MKYIDEYSDPLIAEVLEKKIRAITKNPWAIMEVCGGQTHSILQYGIEDLLPEKINLVHGPGCPVCIMPKERIDHAYILSMQEDVILVTLGDMIKVPGSNGSLQDARSKGADVRFVYSPMDCLKIAKENPTKKIIENTTTAITDFGSDTLFSVSPSKYIRLIIQP